MRLICKAKARGNLHKAYPIRALARTYQAFHPFNPALLLPLQRGLPSGRFERGREPAFREADRLGQLCEGQPPSLCRIDAGSNRAHLCGGEPALRAWECGLREGRLCGLCRLGCGFRCQVQKPCDHAGDKGFRK